MSANMPSEEIRKQIGSIVASWGYIEFQTKKLLALLLNIDLEKTRLVYESFTSYDSKVKLCHRLNNKLKPYPEHKKEITEILNKLKTLNTSRNEIAHSMYGVDLQGNEYMFINYLPNNLEKSNHGKNSQISPECLSTLHGRFDIASSRFDDLLMNIAKDN